MSHRTLRSALLAVALLLLGSCQGGDQTLAVFRNQDRATRLLAALDHDGIPGRASERKSAEGIEWAVTVAAADVAKARELYQRERFYRDDRAGVADLDKGFLQLDTSRSRLQDRAAMTTDLERKLEEQTGVNRVAISFTFADDDRDPLRRKVAAAQAAAEARAAVQIQYYRADARLPERERANGPFDRRAIAFRPESGWCVAEGGVDGDGDAILRLLPAADPAWPLQPDAVADFVAAAVRGLRTEQVSICYLPVGAEAPGVLRQPAPAATRHLGLFLYAVVITIVCGGLLFVAIRQGRRTAARLEVDADAEERQTVALAAEGRP